MLPLTGVRVVDFSRLLPGPYASLVLADLGADVIKVEPSRGGDYLRWLPPLAGKKSFAFAALNGGKRSLAVDLKHAGGAEVARRLVDAADVLIESFRPGVMDRLGLGFEQVRITNPGLVYCAISGYGQTGPYRDRAGHDLNYCALAGVVGLAGPAAGAPALAPVQLADIGGGALWSLVGVLAALHLRRDTGEGAFIDISMTEGALSFLQMPLAAHLGGGAPAPARGQDTLTGGQACYAIYETADARYMSVAALEPKFWQALCAAIERPDLLGKAFGDPAAAERTRAELAAVFRRRTQAEWVETFAAVDACVEPVLAPAEVATHPLHRARANVIDDQEGMGRLRTPLRPADAPAPGAAPELGAHSQAILAELGFDSSRIEALLSSGAVVGPRDHAG